MRKKCSLRKKLVLSVAAVLALLVMAFHPFGLKELWPAGAGPIEIGRRDRRKDPAWAAVFGGLDRALHTYERRARSSSPRPGRRLRRHPATPGAAPVRAVRRAAIRRCAEWIIARQEADGCWGGIQPPWVYSLIALRLLGYGLDHPVIRRGLAGLDRFTITEDSPEGPVRRMEACQSPVWDTVLAMIALADAGLPAGHPALTRAADWLLTEEIAGPGDWQVRRPGLAPGGWGFEFDNDNYADIDDTAEVVLALRRVRLSLPPPRAPAPPPPRHPRPRLPPRAPARRRPVTPVLTFRSGAGRAPQGCHLPRA